MDLNIAYGLSYAPKRGIVMRVDGKSYDWLFNVSKCQTTRIVLPQTDNRDYHEFVLPIEDRQNIERYLKDFIELLGYLNGTPVFYRKCRPQLIELELAQVENSYMLSGGMHNDLRSWCLAMLSRNGPYSTKIRELCCHVWDKSNPSFSVSNPDSFYCQSEGEVIQLGRRGGGIGAVIKPGSNHAEIVATNADSLAAVILITAQLALIEKAYRNRTGVNGF